MKLFNESIKYLDNDADIKRNMKVVTCSKCKREMLWEIVQANGSTCAYCDTLFRVPAYKRIDMIADTGTFEEIDKDRTSTDPLEFPQYKEKIKKAQQSSGLNEAIICGTCTINGYNASLAVMDPYFMMGSMGEIVGEKIVSIAQKSLEEKTPLIIFCASGGARMQEGIISLMQMSRTTIAINKLHDAGILYISVLTDPTTGGVTASFAMQGDIILSEPKALIGFAGPRVIKQTVKDSLPKGFQTAEYLLKNGMIDAIIARTDMKEKLGELLYLHL